MHSIQMICPKTTKELITHLSFRKMRKVRDHSGMCTSWGMDSFQMEFGYVRERHNKLKRQIEQERVCTIMNSRMTDRREEWKWIQMRRKQNAKRQTVCVYLRYSTVSVGVNLSLRRLWELHVLFAHHESSKLLQHHSDTVGVLPLRQRWHCPRLHLNTQRETQKFHYVVLIIKKHTHSRNLLQDYRKTLSLYLLQCGKMCSLQNSIATVSLSFVSRMLRQQVFSNLKSVINESGDR